MRRFTVTALASLVLSSVALLGGCGGDEGTSEVAPSPEAKKADAGVQNAMKDFMQTKGASKSKAKSKPAPAPTPTEPAPASNP